MALTSRMARLTDLHLNAIYPVSMHLLPLLMRFLLSWVLHASGCADVQDSSEGIVKLWGEDALLDWPGALEPIIEERDMVMANVLRACASGMV